MRRVILLAEAREDALEAFHWYENERPDLGKVFRAELNDTIRRVRSSPLASAVVYRDLRRALVHRFPYAVFYRVQPDVKSRCAHSGCARARAHGHPPAASQREFSRASAPGRVALDRPGADDPSLRLGCSGGRVLMLSEPLVVVATLARIKVECRNRRHERVVDQHAWLRRVVVGRDNYYAVPTNSDALKRFHYSVERIWYRSLQRRSQRGSWRVGQIRRFAARFPLPVPTIRHPWPTERFGARIAQGGSPVREIRSPGSVRGAR